MLNIDNISKGFGSQILFAKTGFQINPKERIGLVGRNGYGKTTLLNMISGRDAPDEGSINFPSGYKIGVLPQKIVFSKNNIIDEAMTVLSEQEKEHDWKAKKILTGLGFIKSDFAKNPLLFSGGFQIRLNLAKVLLSSPDLLVLDEPTNYLDITSVRWISQFLVSWQNQVLLVTHDRSFMDKVVTHIAGIHRHKIKKIQGSTGKYYFQIAQDEEIYEKTRLNEEKKRKEIEVFISRFRAKARLANLVQSRIKTLNKLNPKQRLTKEKKLEFEFNYLSFHGKQVMKIKDLSFGWEKNKLLIDDFSMTVYPHDRIGVIGKNGKGKTSFLKLLSRHIKADSGSIKINPGVETGYFEQTNVQSLNDELTIEEELLHFSDISDKQAIRNICGAMMFEKDSALKKISVLSGGEKSRVMLGKLLLTPLNLLLLDEPGNHLDIEACDSFIYALDNFKGAFFLITHNEMFLNCLVNRLIVFKNDTIKVFEGSYQEFLEKEGWEENANKNFGKKEKKASISKKQIRQKKSEIILKKSQQIKPLQKKITQFENTIEQNEKIITKINHELIKASEIQDGKKIQILSKELADIENQNEVLFDELAKKFETFTKIQTKFDKDLKDI